jgi:HEAT repeat protein
MLVHYTFYPEAEKVRNATAVALGKIGDATSKKYLIRALKDKDQQVRESAKIALERIKNR